MNFDGTLAGAGIGEVISFAGSGVGGLGAIRVLGDHHVTLSGNITFMAGAPWVFGVDGGSLTTTGVIDDQGSNRALTKVGLGTLVIGGTADNTYGGGTVVNAGILSVTNTSGDGLGDTPGLVTVNGGGTLSVASGIAIPNNVTLNPGGTLTGGGVVAAVTSNGGIISPGVGAGLLLSSSNVTFNSSSTFLVDVNSAMTPINSSPSTGSISTARNLCSPAISPALRAPR